MKAFPVDQTAEVIAITVKGKIIRLETDRIRETAGRSALGVKLINLEADDQVADVTLVPFEEVVEPDEE